ncbi:hypothetical protein DOY81_013790, partial [Sarcophaga bullata]
PAKTDSGVLSQSTKTKDNHCTARSISSLPERSADMHVKQRQLPRTMSFVAGVFLFKIFKTHEMDPEIHELELDEPEKDKPLINVTISQPSFMITQNINDSVVSFSIFNLSIALPNMADAKQSMPNTNLFPGNIVDTMPGSLTSTGIPPSLMTYKCHLTKQKMREIDIVLAKPLVITISERNISGICRNLMTIYNAVHTKCCVTCSPEAPVFRKSKIMLMKQHTLNADRFSFKCHNIAFILTDHFEYQCKLVFNDLKINLKYLSRPEKCSVKYSLGAVYFRTKNKIFLHPVSLNGSIDFISEPWHRLPLINAIVKFNVIQIDFGIYAILQLRHALRDIDIILTPTSGCCQSKRLMELKCPKLSSFIRNNKSLKREEFYQDDLRAGAFQFVELTSDSVLPLPYQIQIIKELRHYMLALSSTKKIVENPIHIKCRMEYFSDVHESFLHYCDFWLSETNSKDIKLPEREICATIWRVVILQSLVSINGECFDTSEEDEELNSIASMNIEEVLGKGRQDADFMLHPKVLVGCMRVDTTFQSNCVPKIEILLSCNLIKVKLLNQPDENADLPPLLKKFRLATTTPISQVFVIFS